MAHFGTFSARRCKTNPPRTIPAQNEPTARPKTGHFGTKWHISRGPGAKRTHRDERSSRRNGPLRDRALVVGEDQSLQGGGLLPDRLALLGVGDGAGAGVGADRGDGRD